MIIRKRFFPIDGRLLRYSRRILSSLRGKFRLAHSLFSTSVRISRKPTCTELVGGLPYPPPEGAYRGEGPLRKAASTALLKLAYYMPNLRARNYNDFIFDGSPKGKGLHKSLELLP